MVSGRGASYERGSGMIDAPYPEGETSIGPSQPADVPHELRDLTAKLPCLMKENEFPNRMIEGFQY